ncbi:hypothetical protein [Phenylobacterium sp.]|uniref:hypothetical protein n=1 Tax=Phenylobacterium sp. TaxID=1871053 RepID=UPI002F40A66E
MTEAYYSGVIAKSAKTPPLEDFLPKKRAEKARPPAEPKTPEQLQAVMFQWAFATATLQ